MGLIKYRLGELIAQRREKYDGLHSTFIRRSFDQGAYTAESWVKELPGWGKASSSPALRIVFA